MAGPKAHPQAPSAAQRTAGMLAAFVTSGAIHEVMFWYAEGRMTGLWLTFFSVQVRHVCHSVAQGLATCIASGLASRARSPCPATHQRGLADANMARLAEC